MKWIDEIESSLCVTIMMFMLVILFYQVITRYFFRFTHAWTDELARYLMVWLAYLSACYAIVVNAHIKVDSFLLLWPKSWRNGVKLFSNVIFFVYCVVVFYYSATWVMGLARSGGITLGMKLPMALICSIIPIAHLTMALRLLQLEYRLIKNPELLKDYQE